MSSRRPSKKEFRASRNKRLLNNTSNVTQGVRKKHKTNTQVKIEKKSEPTLTLKRRSRRSNDNQTIHDDAQTFIKQEYQDESESSTDSESVELSEESSGEEYKAPRSRPNRSSSLKYGCRIILPLESDGKYNFTVDWGDGKQDEITSFDQVEKEHTYRKAGRYIVQILGLVNGFAFSYYDGSKGLQKSRPSSDQIVDISQWGCLGLSPHGYQFAMCVNLNCSARDAPNLTSVTSFSSMFQFSI